MYSLNISFSTVLVFLISLPCLTGMLSCTGSDMENMETENLTVVEMPMNFQATPNDGAIELNWVVPSSSNIIGVLILRNEISQPDNHLDGVEIFRGEATEFTDSPLNNGLRYYYAIYTFDDQQNFSEAVFADATPNENNSNVNPFVLYMSPNGSDSNDGLSVTSPLLGLKKVQEMLLELKPVIDCDVEVRIEFLDNVSYLEQTVRWKHTSPDYSISFMPLDYNYGDTDEDISGRPIFDGNGEQEWFFDLISTSEASNVHFYYIRIQGYLKGGIRFKGSASNYEEWNGYNKIYGCSFYNIGNKEYQSEPLGYAAIDLVNSDHNWIRNNHFVKCENKKGDESHMHGVYFAHNSSYNLVEYNQFKFISGDPVRIRDFSNYNRIYNNNIEQSGKYAYYSTYRNVEKEECRSWENEFRKNTVNCGYSGEEIRLFRYFVRWEGDGALDDGPQYPNGECQNFLNRLYTSENDRPCF